MTAMHLPIAAVGLALVLTGCANMGMGSGARTPAAAAMLSDKDGADRGRVDLFRDGTGLRLEVVARGFIPGTYGMHIHMVGKCDGPDFMTAGAHWNPAGAQHGRDNPLGAHQGDLPNLVVETGMIGRVTIRIPDGAMTGDGGVMDGDGAAFIIHAQPDDLRTDPTGNSGARVVCGVLSAG